MLVCKVCYNAINAIDENGKKICPICSGYEFEDKEISVRPKCTYCGIEWVKEKSSYKEPPFYNSNNNTFYCGCLGWD